MIKTFVNQVLAEENGKNEKKQHVGLEKDSLDAQIDAYLVAAEKRSRENGIDVDLFAAELVRLAENFENLVDVKMTVISRGISYAQEKFDKTLVKDLTSALVDYHDIDLGSRADTLSKTPLGVGSLPTDAVSGGGSI